jgi:hypothetical protein
MRQPRIAKDLPAHARKPQPWVRSRFHLAFVRTLPCLSCGARGPSEPAHVRCETDGAAGRKPGDRYVVPLCSGCHAQQHRVGEITFWGERLAWEISDVVGVADRLWIVSGDFEAGHRAIQHARPGLPTAGMT